MREKELVILIALFAVISILLIKEPSYTGYVVLDKPSFDINLEKNKIITKYLIIKNNENESKYFNIYQIGLKDLLFITDARFGLKPGEEKRIELNFIGNKEGDFSGSLRIQSKGFDKTIPINLKVYQTSLLLNVNIKIAPDYKEINLGEQLMALIEIENSGIIKDADLSVFYYITDLNDNIFSEETETLPLDKRDYFSKTFTATSHLASGDYLARVDIKYDNYYATASDDFTINEEAQEKLSPKRNNFLFSFFLILSIVIIVYFVKKKKIMRK